MTPVSSDRSPGGGRSFYAVLYAYAAPGFRQVADGLLEVTGSASLGYLSQQDDDAETPDGSEQAQPSLGVYLGIRYTALTSDMAEQFGITDLQGAAIGEVVAGSPAEKAGLQQMDVITAVDGKPLSDTYTLINALSGHKPGDKVKLTVWRMGQSETIEVTLGAPAGQG